LVTEIEVTALRLRSVRLRHEVNEVEVTTLRPRSARLRPRGG
jgi:hypothetical protein